MKKIPREKHYAIKHSKVCLCVLEHSLCTYTYLISIKFLIPLVEDKFLLLVCDLYLHLVLERFSLKEIAYWLYNTIHANFCNEFLHFESPIRVRILPNATSVIDNRGVLLCKL